MNLLQPRRVAMPALGAFGGSCLALVAENEPVQALDLEYCLRGLGCSVLGPAGSAAEAMDLLRRRRPDLALVDTTLPDGGALQVAKALAAEAVPFAVLATGSEDGRIAEHPLLRDALQLLKPYRATDLRQSVRGLLRADLEARLMAAERRIAEGRERIARQARLVRRFAAGGHDTALAEKLLREMARSLRLMRAHREQIRRALANDSLARYACSGQPGLG